MSSLYQEIGQKVARLSPEAYFVGGCVRDLLLGDRIKDVDLALRGDTKEIGRALKQQFGGHVFWLHEEEGIVRVLLPEPDGSQLQLDLCPLKGSLEEDLLARDLSFNALAIAAQEGLIPGAPRIDLAGGERDLQERVVRFVRPSAPESDPLRTLRALRFRWKLGCTLPEETVERIRACVPLLSRVSVERVRDELFQLLAMPCAADALREALGFGLGPWLMGADVEWPDGDTGPEPAVRLARMAALVNQGPTELHSVLEQEVTPPRRRREVLLWAAALQPAVERGQDAGKLARYLALSSDEYQLITRGLAGAPKVGELVAQWPVAGHVRYRLFRQTGAAGPEAVLLSATQLDWSPAHTELLEEALRRHLRPEAPLLTGTEVMRLLNLKPGPEIGQLLTAVEEARADGILNTPQEAEAWLREQKPSS